MSEKSEIFKKKSSKIADDLQHRRIINYNISKYDAAVKRGKEQYFDLEHAKNMAKDAKWRAVENLGKYLEIFENNFIEKGGKVIWAENAEQAIDEILHIAKLKKAKAVVKSKSMATEEIHLNEALISNGIETIETDLGEYIVQLAGEKPYHIVTPAMHKSKEDIQQLFQDKFGVGKDKDPTQLTNIARQKLRNKYINAEIGITGANFLVADTGSIAITENEGNARLSTAFPKVHIAIVGIEKVIPSITDLATFFPLLSTFGTGQKITVYNSIISGPKQPDEDNGPEEMYVILLDNGRTNLLSQRIELREALHCIRCGACLNTCPVYKNIGGHAYDTVYSGPIGAVITPHLKEGNSFDHLSHASSLCGSCTSVCPMDIDLHNLLALNRNIGIESGSAKSLLWTSWKKMMLSRKLMNLGGATTKNFFLNLFFSSKWGKNKKMPKVHKSFNIYWKDKYGEIK